MSAPAAPAAPATKAAPRTAYAIALPRVLRDAAPVLPLLLLICSLGLPVAPGAAEAGGGGTPADAISAGVVVFCVVRAVRRAERPLTRTGALVLGLPVIGIAVAAVGANTLPDAVTGMVRYCQVFVLVPVAVVLLVRDRRDFRLVAWTLVGLALWQGAIGVHQYLTGTGASYAGADIRAVGTFGPSDVMGMATVVAYGVICAVALALGSDNARQRAPALLCALLLVLPLTLSFSRGAWIATALACTAQVLLAGLRRAVRLIVVAAAVGVVLVGGLGIGTAMLQERLSSITQVTDAPDQSVTDRYTMWAAAIDMWQERPVTGVGLKNFPAHRDSHASLALSSGSDTAGAGAGFRRQPLLSPHNMYLLVLSEQGLLGLCAMAGSWAALLVLGLRRLHRVRTAAYGTTRPVPYGTTRSVPYGTDCALVACGLLLWQLIDFAYADIGGPSTVLTSLVFGLAAWWALAPAAHLKEAPRP
ncbi:O-antigen ligase family protein [Streptomyces sp. E11-3]|uniref:O-antigen ligase family protein n=1 Tax=Streptomyces sp. E11-3 TaxID=3110112 RepID=UPI003980D384